MNPKKLLITFTFVLVVLFNGCKKDTFVETVGVCPVVASTIPANGAINVPLDQIISATFNEKMNPTTISQGTLTMQVSTKSTNAIITGLVTYDDATATISFVPSSPLVSNTSYSCVISEGIKDNSGNALQSDFVWTFSTGAVLVPMVVSTNPANNSTGILLNKTITATFNVPIDQLSITAATFSIKDSATSIAIAGVFSFSGTVVSFNPTIDLTSNTNYIGTITVGVKNVAGISIANDYIWTFKTGSLTAPTVISTDPINNATGIVFTKTITAKFSEVMNPLSLNTTSFIISDGTTNILGTISYLDSTVSFDPSSDLKSGTVYTATITTDATNLIGSPLANDYVWTFTAFVMPAPTVILTNPTNNKSNVVLTEVITAKFSEPMDASTFTALSFTIKIGATAIAGSMLYTDSSIVFTPSVNLLSGVTYTATIATAVTNVAGIALASDYVWNFSTIAPLGPIVVDLKSVDQFGIIAGVGVSNNAGFSEIHDLNVGISPGVRSSITGFPPAILVNGVMYASDDIVPPGVSAILIQAKQDLTDAYLFAEGATAPAPATIAGDQGGITLAPGIYKSTSTLLIQSGSLTLDGQGDANAVWIFQIASDFTTVGGAGGDVILIGGAQAKNVFWQVGSSATIGDGTSFKGNVLALTSITMNSGATAEGRMLARNGSVVLTSTNIITKP